VPQEVRPLPPLRGDSLERGQVERVWNLNLSGSRGTGMCQSSCCFVEFRKPHVVRSIRITRRKVSVGCSLSWTLM
jgi:hypothetical protein